MKQSILDARTRCQVPQDLRPCRVLFQPSRHFQRGFEIPATASAISVLRSLHALFAPLLIDCDIVGCNWIELPAATRRRRPDCMTECQAECDVAFNSLFAQARRRMDGPRATSRLDIEAWAERTFPGRPGPRHPDRLRRYGAGSKTSLAHNVHLGGASPSSAPRSSASRPRRKSSWLVEFIQKVDDIITGYNICNFDVPSSTAPRSSRFIRASPAGAASRAASAA